MVSRRRISTWARARTSVVAGAALLALAGPAAARGVARPSAATRRAPRVTGRLTGPYRWVRVDENHNGEADRLRLEGFVRVKAGGRDSVDLHLAGMLSSGSNYITSQPHDGLQADFMVRPIGRFGVGIHPFEYDFGGEAIRRSGFDGPYRADLDLWGGYPDHVDSATVESPPFRCREFGELEYRLVGATERAEDADGDGLYEAIVVEARVSSSQRQRVEVRAMMSARGGPVEFEESSGEAAVGPGVSTVPVRIEGSTICRGRVDGPYQIEVVVLSMISDQTSREFRTRPYRWRSFIPPDLELRPGATRAIEIAGRFAGDRRLDVELPVAVHRSGEFQCNAYIPAGGANHVGTFSGRLEAGARTLRLAFGSAPFDPAHPPTVRDCRCFRADDLRLLEDFDFVAGESITAADLAPETSPSLELSGPCLPRRVDADGDGTFEQLEFAIPAVSRRAGPVNVSGTLDAPNFGVIEDTNDWQNVPAGQCTLRVRFDGPMINAIGRDGPFRLYGFSARRPSRWGAAIAGVSLEGECPTPPFRAMEFERPARVIGRVLRRNRAVHFARIVAQRSTPGFASADASGRYALPVPRITGGKIHVRLQLAPGEDPSRWRVVVGGKTVATNGESDIPIVPQQDVHVDFVHD